LFIAAAASKSGFSQAAPAAMSNSDTVQMKRDGPVHEYLVAHSVRPHPQLQALQAASLQHPRAGMCSPPDSVAVLQQLLRLVGAKKVIEVGVFTGYTALGMALALPKDGKLVACDISTDFTDIGKPYWAEAGVANVIDLKIAPASQTMQGLLDEGQAGTFDAVFIDADKVSIVLPADDKPADID